MSDTGYTQFQPIDLNPGATQDHNRTETDGFLDDEFAPLDLRTGPEALAAELSQVAEDNPEFAPTPEEIQAADGPVIDQAAPPVEETPAPAAPEQIVYEYPDGAKVVVEKNSKGWMATLTGNGVPKPEIFYGKTKDELFANVAYGKVNATQKIRQLNKEKKLSSSAPAAPAVQPALSTPTVRKLTADEIFEVKTQLQADPDLALQQWFQKKTGLTIEQLVALAQQGQDAKVELDTEGVAKAFLSSHPDYYPDTEFENYHALLAWIAKYKAHQPTTVTAANAEAVLAGLARAGYWTLQNLNEAYDDLSDDGLLKLAPADVEDEEEEETPAAPVQVTPPATPAAPTAPATTPSQDPRIVSTVRRSRAGLGLRAHETTTVRATAQPTGPSSAEELDNLSDDQINQLFAGVRRTKASARR